MKVNVLNLVTYLEWTPICEWYVIKCGSKNRHKKYTCFKKIGLCV